MRRQTANVALVAASIVFILAAGAIFLVQLVAYSQHRERMPAGLSVAGVPVGGLTRGEALQQVAAAYSTHLELHYGAGGVIGLDPATVSFRLDTDSMLAIADTYRTDASFWNGFWAYLWNQPGQPASVPLKAEYSETQLRQVLGEIAQVYDREASSPVADPQTGAFVPASPGRALDIEASLPLIDRALREPTNRRVALVITEGSAAHATLDQLETLIKELITAHGFDGLVSLYVADLGTGQELIFTTQNGQDLPRDPGLAFSGMSIMKIPIMVDTYRALDGPPDPDITAQLVDTIELSGNFTANQLLQEIGGGDADAGWKQVTGDMQALGLASTFLAGYYEDVRPASTPVTPGNSRPDINTHADPYMQTTAADMGALLVDIYQCAKTGGGAFQAVWPDRITPGECQTMLDYLERNKTGVLIEGGVPDGTPVAHKHGWISDTNGDSGIVLSPGGDYVISMFIWRQDFLAWDISSPLFAEISHAVYNYFNP
jgi:Beta-lactamase enzyme family